MQEMLGLSQDPEGDRTRDAISGTAQRCPFEWSEEYLQDSATLWAG
jgi:hypothetical protein